MIEFNRKELVVTKFSNKTMELVIQYIYTDKTNAKSFKELSNLLVASDYFQLNDLKKLCERKLVDLVNQSKDEDNLIHLFLVGKNSSSDKLVELMVWEMGQKWDSISKNQKFLEWINPDDQKLVKDNMYPPEEYRKIQNKLKVKMAKKFGFLANKK